MDYLSSDQARKYILINFSLFDLFCPFDLPNFEKTQMTVHESAYLGISLKWK